MKIRENIISGIEKEIVCLEKIIKEIISDIGDIPIANKHIMPFGWRKAAKGRTVWRIIEEVISQNLEINAKTLGFYEIKPAESEVGVYDFKFCYNSGIETFVNAKSSVIDGKRNKDDISKAAALIEFYKNNPEANLYIATFIIRFNKDMTISIVDCTIFPIAWIPDVYINPSNNGNLQSADYKYINKAQKRTNQEFLKIFIAEYEKAITKKNKKNLN